MLELKDIRKQYTTGEMTVHALKGVSISFREHEFVSILGPSGCGKTTLLNIVGGLDQYTAGDLIIDGKSTKKFNDRDWDAYRNYSIGFVFQSYNLIPHQTVLQNVELALTLSGVSKKERKERARMALEQVGLGNQLHKRPAEMSGGQMQRVAIARALVNNPDIILADEPTGALDSETSVQVMEILKEVAKDRLVIMVTHNPELANQYSTRIIRMLDGEIMSDTMPLTEDERHELKDKEPLFSKNLKLPSMSMATSFGLSLKNLVTKKGRTMLTIFAGSIGIIGIALIYAVSNGTTSYIDRVQQETLASYPITLQSTTVDLTSLMTTFMGMHSADEEVTHDMDAIYTSKSMLEMVNALNNIETTENDLQEFKTNLDAALADTENTQLREATTGVAYTYDFGLIVYTKDPDGNIILSDSQVALRNAIYENMDMSVYGRTTASGTSSGSTGYSATSGYSGMSSGGMSSMMGGSTELWTEMLAGYNGELINDVIKDQYDVVYGSWPTAANEVVLILDENNEIDDLSLYALGLLDKAYIDGIFQEEAAEETGSEDEGDNKADGTESKNAEDKETVRYSYDQICNMDFRVVLNSSCYSYDADTETYIDLRDTDTGLQYLYDNGFDIKVVGIIKASPDATSAMLNGAIGYTRLLTEYVVAQAEGADAVKAQLKDETVDIFTGLPFAENSENLTEEEKANGFRDYVYGMSEEKKAQAYVAIKSIPDEEYLNSTVSDSLAQTDKEDLKLQLATVMGQQMAMDTDEILSYLDEMSEEDLDALLEQAVSTQIQQQYAMGVAQQLEGLTTAQMATALNNEMNDYTDADCAKYYDNVMEFSTATYKGNLSKLGYVDLDNPSTISLYASSFSNKDILEDFIAEYNKGQDDLHQITYTDYVGLMMSSITTIINAITYVLIAFVAISLIVSSIMIGVITLISVQERTKEIGILRAIGASKKNVSGMFNAETIMIGFASGVFGVVVTYILCIPINAIIHMLTKINNLSAFLPPTTAGILIVISTLLTLISGIIPSRSAAKKDPVVALRTE